MFIRSLVTVATVALAGSMVHANTGPRPGGGGGSGTRTTTVAVSARTMTAISSMAPRLNAGQVVNAAIAPYVGNSNFAAARVVSAVDALVVAIQAKLPANTRLTPEQIDGLEGAVRFAAITAAAGDTAYTKKVHDFLANGVASTILGGENEKGELTNAVAFLKAASTPNSSMDPDALKRFVDGLVHQMLRNPANPEVRLTGLEDSAFVPSDCFGGRAG